jgi:hypothetical protein
VVVTGDDRHESTWADYPYHGETGGVFVLAVSDRLASGIYVLPRRAAAGDLDRLRALLGRRSTRLYCSGGRCRRVPPRQPVTPHSG